MYNSGGAITVLLETPHLNAAIALVYSSQTVHPCELVLGRI